MRLAEPLRDGGPRMIPCLCTSGRQTPEFCAGGRRVMLYVADGENVVRVRDRGDRLKSSGDISDAGFTIDDIISEAGLKRT